MKRNLYQILGVEQDASAESISAAFAAAQSKFQQGAHDRNEWVMVREAHDVLSNPMKRQMYDAARTAPPISRVVRVDDEAPARGRSLKILVAVIVGVIAVGWWFSRKPAIRPEAVQQVEQANAPAGVVPVNPAAPLSPAAPVAIAGAEQLYAQIAPNVMRIDVYDAGGSRLLGNGSGVALSGDTVVTNCHVALVGPRLRARTAHGVFDATVEAADEERDLCRLQVRGLNAASLALGNAGGMQVGQKVYALGAPQGLELTLSEGIVSSFRSTSEGNVIQTTAPISPGSSGGGLFDAGGRLVGITTFTRVDGQNLNFALPADWIPEIRTRRGTGLIGKFEKGQREVSDVDPSATDKVEGAWQCHDAIGGTSMTMVFQANGVLYGKVNGKDFKGQYQVTDKQLYLRLSNTEGVALKVEYLTESKMVFYMTRGYRTVCVR